MRFFCYDDEENGHRACMSDHLTTANQNEIRRAYLISAWKRRMERVTEKIIEGNSDFYFIVFYGENVGGERVRWTENLDMIIRMELKSWIKNSFIDWKNLRRCYLNDNRCI